MRPLIRLASRLPIFLFFSAETGSGFFIEMSIIPASDIVSNIVRDIPLSDGTMAFAGVPFNDRPKFLVIWRLNPFFPCLSKELKATNYLEKVGGPRFWFRPPRKSIRKGLVDFLEKLSVAGESTLPGSMDGPRGECAFPLR